MARIELDVGKTFIFETEIPVRISDINYGCHVGNDAFISLIHESRIQFFNHLGYTETDIEGKSLVISDLAVIYKSQAFYGDMLKFEVNVADFNNNGSDLRILCKNSKTGVLVLKAKTGVVFFDYTRKKVASVPEKFRLMVT